MELPPQPDVNQYMTIIQNYDLWSSYVMLGAFSGAGAVILRNKQLIRRGIRLPRALWFILILATVLRIPLLNDPYWYDETFTSVIAQTPLESFFSAVMGDVHPPGYYALIKALTSIFGTHDIIMRLPALISSVAVVLVFYHIGRITHSARIGRWCALLVAVAPALVYYGTEARYPAFLALCLSLAYYGIQTKRHWLVSVSLSFAAMSHINAWFSIVIMLGVYMIQGGQWRALLLPVLSISSWLPIAAIQSRDITDGFWLQLKQPFAHIIQMTINDRFPDVTIATIVIISFTGVMMLALFRWRKNATLLWFAVVVLAPLAQYIVSLLWSPIYLPRTLLFSALLLLIPVAWYLDQYANKLVLLLVFIPVGVALFNLYTYERISVLNDAVLSCDGYETVYTVSTSGAVLATHYLPDAHIVVDPESNNLDQTLPLVSRSAMFDEINRLDYIHFIMNDVCIFLNVNHNTTPQQMKQIQHIVNLPGSVNHLFDSKYGTGYYIVTVFEDALQ